MKSSGSNPPKRFEATRWTMIGALKEPPGLGRERALEEFCRIYWYPLYHFARRKGYSPSDSEDLTQALFQKLLAGDALDSLSREKGRVRSFLLRSLTNLMASEWQKRSAGRRGGGASHVSLDVEAAEQRFESEAAGNSTPATPEQEYERHWVGTLMVRAAEHLEGEFRKSDRGEFFTALSPCLGSTSDLSHSELGKQFGMTAGAIKVAVHRLRKRFRALLVEEIGQTVLDPDDVEAEIRHILHIFQ